jgi:transcriptional regulator with XRE-family HTH domain
MGGDTMAIGERIEMARRIAGLSQRGLAAKVGLSPMAVSKYENNKAVPRSELLIRLADALDVGIEFFLRPPRIHHLERSSPECVILTERAEVALKGQIQEWLERYLDAEDLLFGDGAVVRFELPAGFPRAIHSSEEVEEAALDLRRAWDLGSDAIGELMALLEERGVKVCLVQAHADIAACTFLADQVLPVFTVSADQPGDRQRLGLAHKLGHLLLQVPPGWSAEEAESAIQRFARAFLVPAGAARRELGVQRRAISFYELHMLKHKYGICTQAWLDRARDLGILSETDALRLLHPGGDNSSYRSIEPGDPVPPERPTRLKRLVMRLLAEEVINERRAVELLGEPLAQFAQELSQTHGESALLVCR